MLTFNQFLVLQSRFMPPGGLVPKAPNAPAAEATFQNAVRGIGGEHVKEVMPTQDGATWTFQYVFAKPLKDDR